MTKPLPRLLFLLALTAPATWAVASPTLSHELTVELDPADGGLQASDRLSPPPDTKAVTFSLHAGLGPRVEEGAARLTRVGAQGHIERWQLQLDGNGPVVLHWGGTIRHEEQEVDEGMGRARTQSIGSIDADGVLLSGWTAWYPVVDGHLNRFQLDVGLPEGWLALSQGAGPSIDADPASPDRTRVRWREDQPQDEIYLIAGTFTLYEKPTPVAEAQAWLRRPDPALAERYLTVTAAYLERYSRLIGPYPYAKFALVENTWESGYGMPSFTLLGPRVLRLPFILHTSYPHEILHNWWGNGVYIDYAGGNWSEGLTAYLADHLNAELEGRGPEYRRGQLSAYADYVRDGDDFPIRAFRGRHGDASQAVGYGKTLMVFHMLREQLGDAVFIDALRRFYADNRFKAVGFDAMQTAFEQAAGHDLDSFFRAWTERTGAPELALSEVSAFEDEEGWGVRGILSQVQEAAPYPLMVPVVVHPSTSDPVRLQVPLDGRSAAFETRLPGPPVRVAVDPEFDTFRALAPGESPVSLSRLFGADRGLIVLPSQDPKPLREGWRALAEGWVRGQDGWAIVADDAIDRLPDDGAIWLLGWHNRFLGRLLDASGKHFRLAPAGRSLWIDGKDFVDISPVVTAEIDGQPIGFAATDVPDAIPGLARKLPHYGKYGWLTFTGTAPNNQAKGEWRPGESPLVHWIGDQRLVAPLPERPPLIPARP
jgi:aminopeptidase N